MCWCNFTVLTLTQSQKSAVFLTLLHNCNKALCCSYLGPFALLGPFASVTSLITVVFAPRWGLFLFIFVHDSCFLVFFWVFYSFNFLCSCLRLSITPAAQLPNCGLYRTDRQTCGKGLWDSDLFESYSSCWHRLGEKLWAWSWQRWRSEEGRDYWYGLTEHFVCVFVCVCSPKTEGALKTCRYPVCETGLNSGDVPDGISSNFFFFRV